MKKKHILFILILCNTLFSCNYSQKQTKNTSKKEKILEKKVDTSNYYLGIIDEAFYIKKIDTLDLKKAKVVIQKLSKHRPINSNTENKESCLNWKLSIDKVHDFIKYARFSSKNEMMKKFYWEPCEVEINLTINNINYILIFNKGYTGKLIYKNEYYYIVNDSALD